MTEERVVVVAHGVDMAVFNPARAGGRRARFRGSCRGQAVRLLRLHTVDPPDEPGALPEAMVRHAAHGLPHALVIAGGTAGGEPPELLEEIAADLPGVAGRVAWLGRVDDAQLAGLMAEADASRLPRLPGPSGLTALLCHPRADIRFGPVHIGPFSHPEHPSWSRVGLRRDQGDGGSAVVSEPFGASTGSRPGPSRRVAAAPTAPAGGRLLPAGPDRAATKTSGRTAEGGLRALEPVEYYAVCVRPRD